jgi:endopolyphosphatase
MLRVYMQYLRYGELALRYQDTIVGHLYGHM